MNREFCISLTICLTTFLNLNRICGFGSIVIPTPALKRFSTTFLLDKKTFLDEFKVDGEIINPYEVLKVSRNAGKSEIKASYRSLSRKYHPDGVRFRKILPGKCNNLEDVRNQWEKINYSYDLLLDVKKRARYDRNSVLDDPQTALGRMALSTVVWGVGHVGNLLLTMISGALTQVSQDKVVDGRDLRGDMDLEDCTYAREDSL